VIVSDGRVAEFCANALGVLFYPPFQCLGIERDGEIIAGVIFNVFEANDVHLSAVGSGWTREFLAECGHHVYGTLGKGRMTFLTESPRVARYAVRLGGKVEGLMRDHYGEGRNAIVVGILKSEYRY
jgi:hypothetical protein